MVMICEYVIRLAQTYERAVKMKIHDVYVIEHVDTMSTVPDSCCIPWAFYVDNVVTDPSDKSRCIATCRPATIIARTRHNRQHEDDVVEYEQSDAAMVDDMKRATNHLSNQYVFQVEPTPHLSFPHDCICVTIDKCLAGRAIPIIQDGLYNYRLEAVRGAMYSLSISKR